MDYFGSRERGKWQTLFFHHGEPPFCEHLFTLASVHKSQPKWAPSSYIHMLRLVHRKLFRRISTPSPPMHTCTRPQKRKLLRPDHQQTQDRPSGPMVGRYFPVQDIFAINKISSEAGKGSGFEPQLGRSSSFC
jgi:hypothetical protein